MNISAARKLLKHVITLLSHRYARWGGVLPSVYKHDLESVMNEGDQLLYRLEGPADSAHFDDETPRFLARSVDLLDTIDRKMAVYSGDSDEAGSLAEADPETLPARQAVFTIYLRCEGYISNLRLRARLEDLVARLISTDILTRLGVSLELTKMANLHSAHELIAFLIPELQDDLLVR